MLPSSLVSHNQMEKATSRNSDVEDINSQELLAQTPSH